MVFRWDYRMLGEIPSFSDENVAKLECGTMDSQDDCTLNADLSSTPKGARGAASFYLLNLSGELRDTIYENFFSRATTVHATKWLPNGDREEQEPTSHGWSKDAVNLICSCYQVHNEIKRMIFRTNTFAFTPGEIDYPREGRQHPLFNHTFWLYQTPRSTKDMVKNLYVRLENPYFPQSYTHCTRTCRFPRNRDRDWTPESAPPKGFRES